MKKHCSILLIKKRSILWFFIVGEYSILIRQACSRNIVIDHRHTVIQQYDNLSFKTNSSINCISKRQLHDFTENVSTRDAQPPNKMQCQNYIDNNKYSETLSRNFSRSDDDDNITTSEQAPHAT